MKRLLAFFTAVFSISLCLTAENGYDLWLRYGTDTTEAQRLGYDDCNRSYHIGFSGPTADVIAEELQMALTCLAGIWPHENTEADKADIVVALPESGLFDNSLFSDIRTDGFHIVTVKKGRKKTNAILALTPSGALYGTFAYLRLLQTHQDIADLDIVDNPAVSLRMLNHWDNPDGSIERGYAGYSLWNWERLNYDIDPRLIDYARANASVGINGAVINNVNAKAYMLSHEWLVKVAALADAWRPYGIRVYLTAKFSAPIEIGGLDSASPDDPAVQAWWRAKADEIYDLIPDFGGFLVKANSEGQPGPQDYGCTHAQGANMLARALAPHGGVVFWRAFVYLNDRSNDRVLGAYREFAPLDGDFDSNVVVQVKNGPIDFQPREPFHPLFGAMKKTSVGLEVQITQENLGHTGHLVYLGPLYEEVLSSQVDDRGSTVASVIAKAPVSAIAGVANIGSEINWTGHPFAQANWYTFGRQAWNPALSAADIAEEWTRMTFSNNRQAVGTICDIMNGSRETYVNYTMPLGLNHIMNYGTHNGPEPWHDDPVWTAFDYHKITSDSIGVDRTARGTGAAQQYHPVIAATFDSIDTCPENLLLWFHRLPWNYRLKSGKTLWQGLVDSYYSGVDQVRSMQDKWESVRPYIDTQRHARVARLLRNQEQEAIWWRDGCLLFFDSYARKGIPSGREQPAHTLEYYKRIPYPHEWGKYMPQ